MPKYYCDYCDTFLTHDSPSVRKTHCNGRKHKENVRFYYQKWMEEQAQNLIDVTTAAFKANKALVPPTLAFRAPNAPPMLPQAALPPGTRFPPGTSPPPLPIPSGRLPLIPNVPPGSGVPPLILPPLRPITTQVGTNGTAVAGSVQPPPPTIIPGQTVPNPLPQASTFPIPGQLPIPRPPIKFDH